MSCNSLKFNEKFSERNCDNNFRVGEKYAVRREDGADGFSWLKAEIIETRYNHEEDNQEYYVHFEGYERRMDEWVLAYRISQLSEQDYKENKVNDFLKSSDSEVRNITRNKKKELMKKCICIPVKNRSKYNMNLTVAALKKDHEDWTKVKYIVKIQLGNYEINTWYFSPYPEEFRKQPKLWICQFCLKYMSLEITYKMHLDICKYNQPPGLLIYRKGDLSIWEVDGTKHKLYCQLLCLLAKLFLDNKTLFYDTEPFLFYVLCCSSYESDIIVGFFSKEKESDEGYNLSCILTFPPHQRQGYGRLLIELSYELSKREGVCGSPEKPLSDLGARGYQTYWAWVVLKVLQEHQHGSLSIAMISKVTSMTKDDILSTLKSLDMIKYWQSPDSIVITPKMVEEQLKVRKPPRLNLDTSLLFWPLIQPAEMH